MKLDREARHKSDDIESGITPSTTRTDHWKHNCGIPDGHRFKLPTADQCELISTQPFAQHRHSLQT
jgi:hypothetical protein